MEQCSGQCHLDYQNSRSGVAMSCRSPISSCSTTVGRDQLRVSGDVTGIVGGNGNVLNLYQVFDNKDNNAPPGSTQTNPPYLRGTTQPRSTSDWVQIIAKDLQSYYLNTLCKKQVYPWKTGDFVALESIYVPVTIDIEIPGARAIKERLNSYQEIFRTDQKCTRYVLSGNPGQGKSTFCAKLAFDWCNKSVATTTSPLSHIDLLFILELGSVNHESSIESAIRSQLLSIDISEEILAEVIHELGHSVAFVFDGLDEAPLDFMKHQETGNLLRTIKYSHLRECRVLVTTRPWRESEVKLKPYTRLELQKMRKSDVKDYVVKFFGLNNDDYLMIALGKRLLKYINENRLLIDTSTPLVVLLVCWFWAETNGKYGIPDRIGELYDQIISVMYRKMTHPGIEKNVLINRLGEIAAESLTSTTMTIVFLKGALQKSLGEESLQQAQSLGIVCEKGDTLLQFFHKSGQEFCAGIYLQNNPEKLVSYLQDINTIKDVLSVAPVLVFAASSKSTAKIILEKLLSIFKSQIEIQAYYKEELSFDETRPIQQFIELCLECNFEADARAEFSSILRGLFLNGKVLFYGIPSKAAVSLAYYMNCCDPQGICDVTLRPIAHASDPGVFFGPNYEIFSTALHSMKSLPDEKIKQIHDKFVASNKDLHRDWERMYTPTQLAAYIPCIQASEGLPSASETNILPIIDSFKKIKLERLDIGNFKLGDSFDHLLESLERGDMESLKELRPRSSSSSESQMTRLAQSLPKMPQLHKLDISQNKVENGRSIPILAENLNQCSELQALCVNYMQVPACDMELLARNLPPQLTQLAIHGNEMSDAVASHLIKTLPQSLTLLYISVAQLSMSKHNELLELIHGRLTRLQSLLIWGSPYAVDLVHHSALAVTACSELKRFQTQSDNRTLVSEDCVKRFLDAIDKAEHMEKLLMYGLTFANDVFQELLAICRHKSSLKELWFNRDCLPQDVNLDELDQFVFLR